MKKKIVSVIIIILIVVFGLLACSNSLISSNKNDNPEYVVLIGEDREHLTGFPCADTLVIDGEYFTAEDVSYLKEKGVKTLYSYLNIGSIEEFRDCYEKYFLRLCGESHEWRACHVGGRAEEHEARPVCEKCVEADDGKCHNRRTGRPGL